MEDWSHWRTLVYIRKARMGPGRAFNTPRVKKYLHPEASHAHIVEIVKGLARLSYISTTLMAKVLDKSDPQAQSTTIKKTIKSEVSRRLRSESSKS